MHNLIRFKKMFPRLMLLPILGLMLNGSVCEAQDWVKLDTVPYSGKQDDIYFINPDTGWYVNGKGYIYKTLDGGKTWIEQLHQSGTYFRALGFIDELNGFAGNIGPDYFPGVTDINPLYRTLDGGKTWKVVSAIPPNALKGVCSIDVLKSDFINAGHLDHRVTIRAAGRVGGPIGVSTSRDGGISWKTNSSMSAAMILDIKFVDELHGFLCAASDSDIASSHARILKTSDGGEHWKVVYESKRPFETTWKCAFPDKLHGFATIQNYDEDPKNNARYIAKTVDGGDHWTEVPLTNDHSVNEFGIGFIDANTGWVGAMDGGFKTNDGGAHWEHQNMGKAVNKIRIVPSKTGPVVYCIGSDIRKLDLRKKNTK